MPAQTGLTPAQLAALAEFDTPTICNVIELWDIRPRHTGYMNHTIKACFPHLPPMVGYALTSTFRSMSPPRGGDVYSSLDKQIAEFEKLPGPPVIAFQDLDDPVASATFGEVMCSTYKAYGAAGLITSGTGRDLAQVEAIKFPAFTSGATCSHGYCHILSVNTPVTIGGITIYPGDLLHGDLNGVSTVPPEIATEIPEACRGLMAAEDIVLKYLKQPGINAKGLAEARKACSAAINDLAKKLKGK